MKRSSDNKKKIVQAQQHTYIVECVRAVGAQNQIIRGNCKHFAQRKSSSSTYQRLVQMWNVTACMTIFHRLQSKSWIISETTTGYSNNTTAENKMYGNDSTATRVSSLQTHHSTTPPPPPQSNTLYLLHHSLVSTIARVLSGLRMVVTVVPCISYYNISHKLHSHISAFWCCTEVGSSSVPPTKRILNMILCEPKMHVNKLIRLSKENYIYMYMAMQWN